MTVFPYFSLTTLALCQWLARGKDVHGRQHCFQRFWVYRLVRGNKQIFLLILGSIDWLGLCYDALFTFVLCCAVELFSTYLPATNLTSGSLHPYLPPSPPYPMLKCESAEANDQTEKKSNLDSGADMAFNFVEGEGGEANASEANLKLSLLPG